MNLVQRKIINQKFQIEELGNRFEMGQWVENVKVGVDYEVYGGAITFEV